MVFDYVIDVAHLLMSPDGIRAGIIVSFEQTTGFATYPRVLAITALIETLDLRIEGCRIFAQCSVRSYIAQQT